MQFTSSRQGNGRFDGKSLALPVNSVGNVGQLVVDLLIHTWQLENLGQLVSCYLLPSVGANAFSRNGGVLSTELQVFGKGDLIVIQQRSPASLGNEERFAEELASWIRKNNFKQVFLLGSIDAETRRDGQLEGSQIRLQSNRLHTQDWLAETGIQELETRPPGDIPWEESSLPPWSQFRCLKSAYIPCTLLLTFASEGEGNIREAIALANETQKLLSSAKLYSQNQHERWEFPDSWSHVFGSQDGIESY